ncbi:glycerophosphoryl diester phosphodiesterase [Encephalitozoon hellem ATCC 50504]|uniref:Glycerophosphoryldiester phosphodiesterase n=1 Tax=Encephalitozoon hellem TaxID=27973 RepID=A0A9Q9FAP8_ENCHE|nr:glycerophosphoryl diester phosphodiesterase [Encephalitozoon hellem ATCC 50504]AFM97752.1 glycerophosphoryl diester phosphodiesterase [Encephalitozoon hellem ATCC 50504]UTX42445.1 glycerophosphoryldiester phosphodiesterase [Encephalitozoon hellem]WEL37888.1 glycerophosphoryldiester phosphodiesterase [Encephalitozoon hellem]|eukprot:XP_003886733.1 glycerophosphoryl diester phosphodiesterase [Encephalitozoon hellem ATCC 50504]
MEQIDWSDPGFFFRDKLKKSSTTVEEEFRKIKTHRSERNKRTSASMIFCLVVESSREWKGMYVQATLEGKMFEMKARTEIHPQSFLIVEYNKEPARREPLCVNIEVWGPEEMISTKRFRILELEQSSKTPISFRIVYEGREEDVGMEVHCLQTNRNASQVHEDIRVIGHRGCGMNGLPTTKMTENTISSFKEAYRRGARWVETDVQLTKDHVPVIFHDFVIQTSTSSVGISEITLKEFLHIVGNQDEENCSLPCTLSRLLEQIDDRHGVNIEIKYPLPSEERRYKLKNLVPVEKVVEKVVEVVQISRRQKVIFSSFHPYVLLMIKLRLPNFGIFMLTEAKDNGENPYTNTLYDALYFCTKLGLDGVVLDWNCMATNPTDIVKIFKAFDLKTLVYGDEINDRNVIDTLNQAGVNGIIIDDLELICNAGNRDC